MPWIIAAGAVVGGGLAYAGADKAADAAKGASDRSVAEQQRQYNLGMQMLEPQRNIGYQALGDLATLYGYSTPGYQSANSLLYGDSAASNVQGIGPPGRGALSNLAHMSLDPIGLGGLFGGRRDPQVSVKNGLIYFDGRVSGGTLYGGFINPQTGEVEVQPRNGKRDEALSQQATAALRSGQALSGGVWGRFNMALGQLNKAGWKYSASPSSPNNGNIPATPAGQPGNMSRFFTSPDYQFRLNEGQRNLGNSFAARGGAASGNALRALSTFNQGLAAGEYGNYFNRLASMAGMGQTATTQAVNAGQNYANQYSNAQQYGADARASGIMGQTNAINGAINSGLNGMLMNRYFSGGSDPYPWLQPVSVTAPRIG